MKPKSILITLLLIVSSIICLNAKTNGITNSEVIFPSENLNEMVSDDKGNTFVLTARGNNKYTLKKYTKGLMLLREVTIEDETLNFFYAKIIILSNKLFLVTEKQEGNKYLFTVKKLNNRTLSSEKIVSSFETKKIDTWNFKTLQSQIGDHVVFYYSNPRSSILEFKFYNQDFAEVYSTDLECSPEKNTPLYFQDVFMHPTSNKFYLLFTKKYTEVSSTILYCVDSGVKSEKILLKASSHNWQSLRATFTDNDTVLFFGLYTNDKSQMIIEGSGSIEVDINTYEVKEKIDQFSIPFLTKNLNKKEEKITKQVKKGKPIGLSSYQYRKTCVLDNGDIVSVFENRIYVPVANISVALPYSSVTTNIKQIYGDLLLVSYNSSGELQYQVVIEKLGTYKMGFDFIDTFFVEALGNQLYFFSTYISGLTMKIDEQGITTPCKSCAENMTVSGVKVDSETLVFRKPATGLMKITTKE